MLHAHPANVGVPEKSTINNYTSNFLRLVVSFTLSLNREKVYLLAQRLNAVETAAYRSLASKSTEEPFHVENGILVRYLYNRYICNILHSYLNCWCIFKL